MTDNEKILFDARGFMADPVMRACSMEAVGVYDMLIAWYYPGLRLVYEGRPHINFKPRALLRQFADLINDEHPTAKPAQTLAGLRELYDREIITVNSDDYTLRIAPEHDYVAADDGSE